MIDIKKIDKIVNLLLTERKRVLTDDEKLELDEWLKEKPGNQMLYNSLKKEENIRSKLKTLNKYNQDNAYAKFIRQIKGTGNLKIRQFLRYAALLIPFLFVIHVIYQKTFNVESETEMQSEIYPGTSKAILELANGSIVNLETNDKQITEYDGTVVQNTQKKLIYKSAEKKQAPEKIQYNTLTIPRGGEYQLSFPDGTKVWLNAETVLKYPVTFPKEIREVFLQGEAFFEVAKNANCPFIVHISGLEVNVLGTSFNIRAYQDEKEITTTLVSGAISLINAGNGNEFNLTPSEQAVVSGQETHVKKVDVHPFIAWRNGRILFDEKTLEEIFSELSRWYNIEVDYADEDLKKLKFNIDVERYSEFNRILEILELTKKVKFKINGNKVIILKIK